MKEKRKMTRKKRAKKNGTEEKKINHNRNTGKRTATKKYMKRTSYLIQQQQPQVIKVANRYCFYYHA